MMFIFAKHDQEEKNKFIENTENEIKKAYDEGYIAFSSLITEYEPKKNKAMLKIFGPLLMEFYSPDNPELALLDAREMALYLESHYSCDPRLFYYYITPEGKCQLLIPEKVYAGQNFSGSPYLPQMHLVMKRELIRSSKAYITYGSLGLQHHSHISTLQYHIFDDIKTNLLVAENLMYQGAYRVPVSHNEFFKLNFTEILELTKSPRTLFIPVPHEEYESYLPELYKKAKELTLPDEEKLAEGFIVTAEGLYWKSGEKPEDVIKLCSYLKCIGKTRTLESKNWSRLLELQADDGVTKQLRIPMKLLSKPDALFSKLYDEGLRTEPLSRIKNLITIYINSVENIDTYWHITKIGWFENSYILPEKIYGKSKDELLYFESNAPTAYKQSGTLEEWQTQVAEYCKGNSIFELALAYGFTGILLNPLQQEGGGLHLYGDSSTGKTTIATVVGSVCGGGSTKGFVRSWRSTDNALEHAALLHNDNLLILDEIGQADSKVVSAVAYMLTNGQSKTRMTSDILVRPSSTWLLNFLSTGEIKFSEKIEEFGKKFYAGQEVKVIEIPIDQNIGSNAITNLHGFPNESELSEILKKNALTYYGTAQDIFLSKYLEYKEENDNQVTLLHEEFRRFCHQEIQGQGDISGQVNRVINKFATIAAAGELAITFGVLPFEKSTCWKAVFH